MEIRKAHGIVLSSRPTGEADRLVRVYTREYGKNNFVFKGIRKSKKRAMASTEPGTLLNIVYYFNEKKDCYIANEFNIQKQCEQLRGNLEKMFFLFYMLELVDKTTALANPAPRIFDLLNAALNILETTETVTHLVVFFAIHLLRLEGIASHNYYCKTCGRHTFENFAIDPNDLMLICERCASNYVLPYLMNKNVLHFLKQAMIVKFSSLDLHLVSKKEMFDLLFVLSLFVEKYFNIELKSKSIIFSQLTEK